MRLHTLRLQAFGPFGNTQSVDFDVLSQGGLFLLHGDTGAGKSTVFDAICFALYGKPPGDRDLLLRSDHAPHDLLTQVTLDVTISGRRLEITRIPQQQRPKSRGEGTTTQTAQTLMREWTLDDQGHGRWQPSSKSHQEAGQEIIRLLGMSRDQFCQVVLLPQNEFTKFLRASALHRRELLGKLFHTGRFGFIEKWLSERSSATEKEASATRGDVLRVIERLHQAAGPDLKPEDDAPDAEQPDTLTTHAPTWAAALHTAAHQRQQEATEAAATAADDLARQQGLEREVRELARQQNDHQAAQRQYDLLEEQTPHQEELRNRREQAQRAQRLAPVLHALTTARTSHTQAHIDDAAARSVLPTEHAELTTDQLSQAQQTTRSDIGRLTALLGEEAETQQLADELKSLDAERLQAAEEQREARTWLDQEPSRRAELTSRLEAARAADQTSLQLTEALNTLALRLTAAQRRDALALQAQEASRRVDPLRSASLAAGEAYLSIRRQRTDGMAAELASTLQNGAPCPVCGSCTHPAPAAPHPGQPTRQDEDRAETDYTKAQQEQKAAEDEAGRLGQAAAAARGEAGDTPLADLQTQHTTLTHDLTETLERAADAGPAQEQLDHMEREHTLRAQQDIDATARLSGHDATYDALTDRLKALEQRLATARGTATTLTERITQLTTTVDHLAAAAQTARTADQATQERDQRTAEATDQAQAAGFDTPDAAEAALLDEDEARTLEEEINQWHRDRATVSKSLEDPKLLQAAAQPPADIEAATADLAAATDRHTRTATTASSARARTADLADLITELDAHIERLVPLEHAHRTVHHLFKLVNGTSPSNQLRMQLEAYVLTARLEEVVEAANIRLAHMSDHRYALAHTDQRSSGGARSGLGLQVTDAWTGRDRDTDTLSGGESFFVSLSLALALADVVTHEAGGSALDTLFIDEGFGSLDENTLHQVLDVLDSLRAHDRIVGLISHVPDLRRRITNRLHVRKGPAGSSISFVSAAAE